MGRIEQAFASLKSQGRKALVGYITAGDPDMQTSERNVRTILSEGLDILELGVPFSDPTADGPAIQESSQRALKSGATLGGVIEMMKRVRRDFSTPAILFGYANPFMQYGYARLCDDAAAAGIDGFLVVDMPFEEQGELRVHAASHGQTVIPLIAPTTDAKRAAMILKHAAGFVYYIMLKGVTGTRDGGIATDVRSHVEMIRRCTSLPVVVGFGVSNPAQAREAVSDADGVVVGSALVKAAHENRLPGLVTELRSGLAKR